MKTVLSFLVVALLSLPGSLARVGTSHVADEDDHHPRGLERALDDAITYLNPSTIDYNREGKKINPSKGGDLFDGYPDFPHSSIGFLWQDDDDATIKWRPQGISGFEYDGKEYLLVSWYGKKKKRRFDYRNRGFRVSFVDITDMDRIKYRHILFVDEDGETYEDCHAGGLAFKDGVLHIPDSRGSNDQILTFPIDAIEEVDADSYYNYRYVIRATGSYKMPINPSFLGYDPIDDQFLVGSFLQNTDDNKGKAKSLGWYSEDSTEDVSVCADFFWEMQGAAKTNIEGVDVLIVSASYGRSKESRLFLVNFDECSEEDAPMDDEMKRKKIMYPPGMEDVHVSPTSEYVWFLTEFGKKERLPFTPGAKNRRVTFAIKKSKIVDLLGVEADSSDSSDSSDSGEGE